ncbi:hypothetical protein AB0H43_13005 [Hamadaea sp. NPDC050747]|uniref:hypothetical protein n=1 Tax=Hamadaea sp. NPDC050747 TaxID=3155789 RepID=UPI0033C3361B
MEADSAERFVSIPLTRAIEAARDLENIVISLDRIGSHIGSGTADAQTLDRFMTEWLVGPRLSRVRMDLWNAVAREIGEEAVEEIAEAVPCFPEPVPEEVLALDERLRRLNEQWQ